MGIKLSTVICFILLATSSQVHAEKKYQLISFNKNKNTPEEKRVEASNMDYKTCLAARNEFLNTNRATGRGAYCD